MEVKPLTPKILKNDSVKSVQFRSCFDATKTEELVLRIVSCGSGSKICVGIVPPNYNADEEPGYDRFSIGYMGNMNRVYDGSFGSGKSPNEHTPKNPQANEVLWKLRTSHTFAGRTRVELFVRDVLVHQQEITLQEHSMFAIVLKQAKVQTNLDLTLCEGSSTSSSPTSSAVCLTPPPETPITRPSIATISPSALDNVEQSMDGNYNPGPLRAEVQLNGKGGEEFNLHSTTSHCALQFEVLPGTELQCTTDQNVHIYVPQDSVTRPTTIIIQREPPAMTDNGSDMYTFAPSDVLFNQTVYLRFPISNDYDADSEYCLMYQASDEDDWETVEFGAHHNYHTSNCQNAPVWFIEDGFCHLLVKHFCRFYLLKKVFLKLVDWILGRKRIALTWTMDRLNMTTHLELKFHCPDMKTLSEANEKSTTFIKLKRSSGDLTFDFEPVFCTLHDACPRQYVVRQDIWQGLCEYPNGYVVNVYLKTELGGELPILNINYSQPPGNDRCHLLTLPIRNDTDHTSGVKCVLRKLKATAGNVFAKKAKAPGALPAGSHLRRFFKDHPEVGRCFTEKCQEREKEYVETYVSQNWTRSSEITAGESLIHSVCLKSCKTVVGRLEIEDIVPSLLSEGIITNTEKTQMMDILCDGTEQTSKKERRVCLKFFTDILSTKSEDQFWKFILILRNRQLQPVVINLLSNYFLEKISRTKHNSVFTTVETRCPLLPGSSEDSGHYTDSSIPVTLDGIHTPLLSTNKTSCQGFLHAESQPILPDFNFIGPDSVDTPLVTNGQDRISLDEDALMVKDLCSWNPSYNNNRDLQRVESVHMRGQCSSYVVHYNPVTVKADCIHYHNGSPNSTQSRHSTNLSPLFLLPDNLQRSVIELMAATPGQHVFEDLKGQLHLKELDTPDILLQCLLTLPMTSANMRYWVEFIDRLSMCSECGGGEVVKNLAEWVSYAYIFHDENVMKMSSDLVDGTQLFIALGIRFSDWQDINKRQALHTAEKNFLAFSKWRDMNLSDCTIDGLKNLTRVLCNALENDGKRLLAHKFGKKYKLIIDT